MTKLVIRDDAGRKREQPRKPIAGSVFNARPKDRTSVMTGQLRPEDIAMALRDAENGDLHRQSDLFEQMEEKDGALGGFMQTRRMAPANLKYAILPRLNTGPAKKAAEYVREVVAAIPSLRKSFNAASDATGKGCSAQEIDWDTDLKIPAALRWIHPKRYRFARDEEKFLIVPDNEEFKFDEGVEPKPFKIIFHKTNLRLGHPSRVGVLRNLVYPFLFRNYTLKDWGVFSEVFGMPVRVAKYPLNASDEDKMELLDMIRSLGTDAAAIVSQSVEMEYLEATNRGNHPYQALYDTMERQMVLAILGQELTSTAGDHGSRALGQVHQQVRNDLLKFDCEDLQDTYRADLLYPIVGFKYGWGFADQYTPFLKFAYEPKIDTQKQATTDQIVLREFKMGRFISVGEMAKRYDYELMPGVDLEQPLLTEEDLAQPVPKAQGAVPKPDTREADPARPGQRSEADVSGREPN